MSPDALRLREREGSVRAEYSAATGSVILVTRFAVAAVLNYSFGLGLAWLLVPSQFGVVSAVQNVLLLAAGLLTAGLPWALAVRVAQVHGDRQAAGPEFRTALLTNSGLGLLVGAAFAVMQMSALRLVPTGSEVIDLIVAAEMPVLAVNSVLAGAAQGSRRFGGLGAMQGGEILIKCAAAVVLVAVLHMGPAGVALSFLIGTLGSVLIGVWANKGLLPGRGPLASLSFLADSGMIWLASASMTFLITSDFLGLEVLGKAAGVTAAVLAGYQACSLLARASFYAGDALGDVVFPFIARSQSLREKHRWFVAAARWIPLLIVPLQAGLLLAPGPVLRLFLPHHYSAAQPLLRVLAAGTLAALMTDMLMKTLFAVGHGRQIGRRMPIAVLVEIVCLIVLVPRYGPLGAAYSYLIASCACVMVLMPVYLQAMRIRMPSHRRLACYVAGLVPTAGMFALADHVPTLPAWVLIVSGSCLFVLPARRMRLITDADIDFLRGLGARWPSRVPDAARWLSRARRAARALRAALRADWGLAAFCTCIAAVAMLYNTFASPDVLYDEAAYTSAAQKVALGWHLTLDNQPLFVHPPLMFLLQAAWLLLTGHASGMLVPAIRAARLLAASIGAADVLLIAALAYRLASGATPRQRRVVTGVIAAVAALDPVLTRYDRQDVIEPFALCVSLLTLHAAWHLRNRGTLAYVSVTGVLGGLALLTNEITIFLIVVPVLFALLERNGPLLLRSVAALGIMVAFLGLYLLWAADLGLAGSFVTIQTATLRRLIGLVQITGYNIPGVSLVGALLRSVEQYLSSYIVLAVGLAALGWCWSRRDTPSGNFLTAWLTASYAFGGYIVAIGTLNEQFFVYLIPACIVGSVMLADALLAGWIRRSARRRGHPAGLPAGASRLPLAAGGAGCAGLLCLSAVTWFTSYNGVNDGVVLADQFIATRLPACAAVNASGDAEKYQYLLPGRQFSSFSVGPAALADGVHYFLLAPIDAIAQTGNMTPALASWIQGHGRRLAVYPSHVYKTVQLWYVPASPYDPAADTVVIQDGLFINTAGSHCGGYTVTDGHHGAFYSAYQSLGGKAVLGDPLSRLAFLGKGRYEQFTDGAVFAASSSAYPVVRALPIVAMLANRAPAAYRRAGLPPVEAWATGATGATGATAAERRHWLTNPSIRRAYLHGNRNDPRSYAAAVQRYGEPLGPPAVLPGGGVGQAFADVVLEIGGPGARVRAAAVTPAVLAARVLKVPRRAGISQRPPALPNPSPPGLSEPTSAEPFALDLGIALFLYGGVIALLARRRSRAGAGALAAGDLAAGDLAAGDLAAGDPAVVGEPPWAGGTW